MEFAQTSRLSLMWMLVLYAVVNLVTLATFGWDKAAARLDRRRVSERTLHLLVILGGAVGSIAGQQLFRHKTRKRRFAIIAWASLLSHGAIWLTWWWTR